MSRFGAFIFGAITAVVVLIVGGYLFIRGGGVPMATTAKPLPLEKTVANLALKASYGNAAEKKNPLPVRNVAETRDR